MKQFKALKEREGKHIAVLIPRVHTTKMQNVLLYEVEDAGAWIKNPGFSTHALTQLGVSPAGEDLIFFFPWNEIALILDADALSPR